MLEKERSKETLLRDISLRRRSKETLLEKERSKETWFERGE